MTLDRKFYNGVGMERATLSVGPMPEVAQAMRETEIPSKMNQLGYALDSLERVVSELHQRLAPVIALAPTCPEKKKEAGSMTPLGGLLQVHIDRVNNVTDSVGYLLNGVEI